MRISLQRIRLNSGGYDSNSRYWGIGPPLYNVTIDGEVAGQIRAKHNFESKEATTTRVKEAIGKRGAEKAHYSW